MSHVENIQSPKEEDQGTFYCEVCNVEFNSLQTAFSHTNGVVHLEKAQGFKEALKSGVVPTLPTEWRYGQEKYQGTFYCQVCYVELDGLQTMMSHVNGAEHQEKKLVLESKRLEKEMKNLDLD